MLNEADNSGCDVGINMTTVLYLIKSSFKSIFFLIVRERSQFTYCISTKPKKYWEEPSFGVLNFDARAKVLTWS